MVVSRRDLSDVLVTRVLRGAISWAVYRLIRTKMLLHLRVPCRGHQQNATEATFSGLIATSELGEALDLRFNVTFFYN